MTQVGGGGLDQHADGVSDDTGVDSRLILKEQSTELAAKWKVGRKKGNCLLGSGPEPKGTASS